MYFIIDPITKKKWSIFSSQGEEILANYYKNYVNKKGSGDLGKRCVVCYEKGFDSGVCNVSKKRCDKVFLFFVV